MELDDVFHFDLPSTDTKYGRKERKYAVEATADAVQSPSEAEAGRHVTDPRNEGIPEKQPPKEQSVKTVPLKRNDFFEKPSNEDPSPMEFSSMNLSKPLLKACAELSYCRATPIQAAAIPLILSGRDICGSAVTGHTFGNVRLALYVWMTGSGKTAAFALPLIERLLHRPKGITATYVVVISPTRELAAQIHEVITKLTEFTDLRIALIVGGFSLHVQAASLDTRPEIVVATPGRLIDHLRNSRSFDLDDVHALVLDEADKLLKMGFINEITEILRFLPNKRQSILFSATMTEEVQRLMHLSLHKPVRIAADPAGRIPRKLSQVALLFRFDRPGAVRVDEIIRLKGEEMRQQREVLLCALCSRTFSNGHAIIFCSTKRRAHRLKLLFDVLKLPTTAELHSNMSQCARLESLERFRKQEASFLVATDVAGRGLDIVGVEVVINYDAPPSLDTYLHRIGRTARAGAKGRAITFITDANRLLAKEIIASTKQRLISRVIPAEAVSYYQQQLQLHQRHLKVIEQSETENEKLNQAEKEIGVARNKIEHEKEILARPARTWFQSSQQRKKIQKLAKMEDDGMAMETDCAPGKREHQQMDSEAAEAKSVKGSIRAIKRQQRQFEEQGAQPNRASRLALEAMAAPTKKRRRRSDGDDDMDDDAPTEHKSRRRDRKEARSPSSRGARVYSGGAKSGRIVTRTIDKSTRNLLKRKGKGKHAFKGRKRFKRR